MAEEEEESESETLSSQSKETSNKVGPRVGRVLLELDDAQATALLPPEPHSNESRFDGTPCVALEQQAQKQQEEPRFHNPELRRRIANLQKPDKRSCPQSFRPNDAYVDVSFTGESDACFAYHPDVVVHCSSQQNSGSLPLDGILALFEQGTKPTSNQKCHDDAVAIAGAAQAILDADQTRAFVVGACVCLRRKPPRDDPNEKMPLSSPFTCVRLVAFRQDDGKVRAFTTEREVNEQLVAGLATAPLAELGYLKETSWPMTLADGGGELTAVVESALRCLTLKRPKPLVARASCVEHFFDENLVLKIAPPPATLAKRLHTTVATEIEALWDMRQKMNNAAESLPELVAYSDPGSDEWCACLTRPLCASNLETAEPHSLLGDSSKALKLFDTLIDALAQMHDANWIHRDVFSQNIVEEENYHFRLIDLGSATRANQDEQMKFFGNKNWCSLRAHACSDGIRNLKWRWQFRDDLESVYLIFVHYCAQPMFNMSLPEKTSRTKVNMQAAVQGFASTRAWSSDAQKAMHRRLQVLQDMLFSDEENVNEVVAGQDNWSKNPSAVDIRNEIGSDFVLQQKSQRYKSSLLGQ